MICELCGCGCVSKSSQTMSVRFSENQLDVEDEDVLDEGQDESQDELPNELPRIQPRPARVRIFFAPFSFI